LAARPFRDSSFRRFGVGVHALDVHDHDRLVADDSGVMARYIRLTANSWSLVGLEQFGLAEVRFFYVPVEARAPQSANNAKDVSVDATLDWRPGRDERTYPTGSRLSFAPVGLPARAPSVSHR